MRLLDNVHLIESEVLAPPTVSMLTFARSIARSIEHMAAGYELSDS